MKDKKKMLIYAHYFYPDVASTGQILTELCLGLKEKFDVTVICVVPSYSGKIEDKYKKEKFYFEEYNGIHVVRVRVPEFDKKNKISRIKNILSYYFNSKKVAKTLGKFDIVYSISQPPILGGMLGVYGKKVTKGKFIYNIQDFNPEQIMAVKYSKFKILLKFMMYLDKRSCKKSDLIITVGHDMQNTLINRFNNKYVPNNVVINNWINDKEIYPLDKNNNKIKEFKDKYNLNNKFIIMYSGNLGLYYDLENIIKIFVKYKDLKDIAFVFIGDGSIKNKLIEIKEENKADNIYFIPYQDKKDLVYSLNSADIHLVTNAKGIKGVSVPSKIYGCLATNVPVFGILEKNSEADKIINESNCGIVVEPNNYKDIENILKNIIDNKKLFIKEHSTGRKYLEDNLTMDKTINKYIDEIEKLLNKDKKICLISSSGGHLEQIKQLKKIMNNYNYFIVTTKTKSTIKMKEKHYIVSDFKRNNIIVKFLRIIKMFYEQFKIYNKEKPDIIITTGAAVAIPMCLIGKIFRKKVIYIESFARMTTPNKTGLFLYKYADLFIIQWEELKKYYPNAVYGGSIY